MRFLNSTLTLSLAVVSAAAVAQVSRPASGVQPASVKEIINQNGGRDAVAPSLGDFMSIPTPSMRHTRSVDEPQTIFTATEAEFKYYGDLWENGTEVFYLFLSNAGINQGNPEHEGQIARLLLVSDYNYDSPTPVLPTGVFTASDTPEAGALLLSSSSMYDVFPHPEDPDFGLVGYQYQFSSGTVTVTENDGVYTIIMDCEGYTTDEEGYYVDQRKCEATYTGACEEEAIDTGYRPLQTDMILDIPNLSGRYMEGDYTLTFYSVPLDENGYIIGPGQLFNTELFTPDKGYMDTTDLAGTFSVCDVFTEGFVPGCFAAGFWYDFYGWYFPFGTYLSTYNEDESEDVTGLAVDGTITVTPVGDEHRFEFDLTTEYGYKMTGSWQGVVADYVTDYSDPTAVNTIESPKSIKGGNGCVEAPKNARIFNAAGIETCRDNLLPGIYLVRSNGMTTKVFVK